jgi:L-fuconate dehydratase
VRVERREGDAGRLDAEVAEQLAPLWKLVCDMAPDELVRCVDFRHMTDAPTPEEAVDLLESRTGGRAQRETEARRDGLLACTTSVGWLGFTDDEVRRRARAAVAEGWTHVKMKVGGDPDADARRAALIREEIGPGRFLMMDANQVWEVRRGDRAHAAPGRVRPVVDGGADEPRRRARPRPDRACRRPDPRRDGRARPQPRDVQAAHQADAIAVCQLDACRLGGVTRRSPCCCSRRSSECPCPHAGGVGLSEYVQHLSLIDYVAVGGALEDRVIEYVDEPHEHFVDPVRVRDGRYLVPEAPGYSIEMRPESLAEFAFPHGPVWR